MQKITENFLHLLNKKCFKFDTNPIVDLGGITIWNKTTLLVFVDACENLIMVDDVVKPSNPPVSLIEKEELEEAPLDMNFFSSHAKKNYPE